MPWYLWVALCLFVLYLAVCVVYFVNEYRHTPCHRRWAELPFLLKAACIGPLYLLALAFANVLLVGREPRKE